MAIISTNPATEEILAEFSELDLSQIETKLATASSAFSTWKLTSFAERRGLFLKLVSNLRANIPEYGKILTAEMGKSYKESLAELEKCAVTMEMYANEAEKMLAVEQVQTEFSESYVKFEPMGVILAVMPWNFPFWQVLRFAAPALMGGNVAVLKHASNVPQSALLIEKLFKESGFPEGAFQTLLISSSKVEALIRDWRIKAVTLTGSEPAGKQVAKVAGEEIKPVILELGGSDPFIVLADADLDKVIPNAVSARIRNNGQSCIAAKRFIVAAEIYEEFLSRYKLAFEKIVVGDPMLETTELGPISTKQGLEDVESQVAAAAAAGAKIILGGKRLAGKGYFYAPTIITEISETNPLYTQEVFGPVASVYSAGSTAEIVHLANATKFGLGSSIWCKDVAAAKELVPQIEAGSVYVNRVMGSDPRMPFGGVKNSGVGRELSHYGIKAFQNVKSVIVA